MKKRILSIVLTLCMLLSVVPMMSITASAAEERCNGCLLMTEHQWVSDGDMHVYKCVKCATPTQSHSASECASHTDCTLSSHDIDLDLECPACHSDVVWKSVHNDYMGIDEHKCFCSNAECPSSQYPIDTYGEYFHDSTDTKSYCSICNPGGGSGSTGTYTIEEFCEKYSSCVMSGSQPNPTTGLLEYSIGLTDNISLDKPLEINHTCMLALNGASIGYPNATNAGSVIVVDGGSTLSIDDAQQSPSIQPVTVNGKQYYNAIYGGGGTKGNDPENPEKTVTFGGGICSKGNLYINGSVNIVGNSAYYGGGIFVAEGIGEPNFMFGAVTIADNSAIKYGGGLYLSSNSTISFGKNIGGNAPTISGNKANQGAAIFTDSSAYCTLDSVTITDNTTAFRCFDGNTTELTTGAVHGCAQIIITGAVTIKGNVGYCYHMEGSNEIQDTDIVACDFYASVGISLTADSITGSQIGVYKKGNGQFTEKASDDIKVPGGYENCFFVNYHLDTGVTRKIVYNATGEYYAIAESYKVTCATCTNGSVSADVETAIEGAEITLSNTPSTGYVLDSYKVYKTGDENTTVTVTNGKFNMPAFAVTVSATFKTSTVAATGVTLNKNEITLYVGESETLVATVLPENATDKSVTWKSYYEPVATVDEDGKVTAVAQGKTHIQVSNDAGYADCSVIVKKKYDNVTIDYGIYLTSDGNAYKLDSSGQKPILTAPLTPGEGDLAGLTWNGKYSRWEMKNFNFTTLNDVALFIESEELATKPTSYATTTLLVSGTNHIQSCGGVEGSVGIYSINLKIIGNGTIEALSDDSASDGQYSIAFAVSDKLTVGTGVTVRCTTGKATCGTIGMGKPTESKGSQITVNGTVVANAADTIDTGMESIGLNCATLIVGQTGTVEGHGGNTLFISSGVNADVKSKVAGTVVGTSGNAMMSVGVALAEGEVSGEVIGTSNSEINDEYEYQVGFGVYGDPVVLTETAKLVAKSNIVALSPDGFYIANGSKVLASLSKDGTNASATDVVIKSGDENSTFYFGGVTYGKSDPLYVAINMELPEAVKNATYSASLTLGKNIDVNFKMGNITGEVDGKLFITVDGNTVDYQFEDGVASCVLKAVEPKDIGTPLHIVITYDGVTVKNFNYSVLNYCNAVYNHASYGANSDLGKLCTAILNYGKYAEDYANGNTASTLNEGHEIDLSTVSLPQSKKKFTSSTTYGDNGSGAYLELGSTIKLNYLVKTTDFEYILTLVNGMTNAKAVEDGKYKTGQTPFAQTFFILNENKEQIDPAKIEVTQTTGGYIISVDLYAYQLANEYTLKVKGVESKDFEITFGVYDYCVYINENDYSATLKTLCKAIYNYSEAVKAYIG